jgi:putative photosynthetic complex assembly protein 2
VSESTSAAAFPLAPSSARTAPRVTPLLVRSFALVTGYWWLATGLVVAIQRDGPTRLAALGLATGAGAFGAFLLHDERDDASDSATRRSFLGGGLLWLWVAITLYGGWLMGPAPRAVSPGDPLLERAFEAVRSLAYHEAASLVVLALAWWLTRGAANRTGFHGLVALWGMQQLAKLNVFLGVANPNTRFLPEWLRFLETYFGPAQNSVLLPVSIVALSAATYVLARRALRRTDEPGRSTDAMLAWLMALAALEHAFLGIAWNAPLWEGFLQFRG